MYPVLVHLHVREFYAVDVDGLGLAAGMLLVSSSPPQVRITVSTWDKHANLPSGTLFCTFCPNDRSLSPVVMVRSCGSVLT